MSILVGTRVRIIDNTGALRSECIEIYDASKYIGALVGDLILVTLKQVVPNRKVKKGELTKAIVVRSRKSSIRYSGHRIKSADSAIVLLNGSTLLPKAKRAKSVILEEIRKNSKVGLKVLALAPVIV
jgi:large subunit ribosomal protein L14